MASITSTNFSPAPVSEQETAVSSAVLRWPTRRRVIPLRRRRRRVLPTVRLGGNRRRSLMVRIFRGVKLRWIKVKLKKLKEYYYSVVKDMIDGSASVECFQQRLLMEATFAIPVMGLSLNTFPTRP